MKNIAPSHKVAIAIALLTGSAILFSSMSVVHAEKNDDRKEKTEKRQDRKETDSEKGKQRDSQERKKEEIRDAKEDFETKKQDILIRAKSGDISKDEAKRQILEQKDAIISKTKSDIRAEEDRMRQEKRNSLKQIIKKQLTAKLANTDRLEAGKKKEKYRQIKNALDRLIQNSTKAKAEIYQLIKEVINDMENPQT